MHSAPLQWRCPTGIPAADSISPSLWRHRNFILLVWAYFISAFGDHLTEAAVMQEMAIGSAQEKTRISAQLLFFFFLPYALLGPLAGAVADRLPRRAIMIGADVARAAIALAMPFYIRALPDSATAGWPMMMPVLGLGFCACFFNPARQALVPQIVPDEHLTRANSVLNGLAPIASIFSFVAGGWLASMTRINLAGLTVSGTTINFISDAASFVASAALIAMIATAPPARPATRRPIMGDMVAGLRYIAAHRHVGQLTIFTAVFWTAAGAFSSLMTTVVFDWYHLDIGFWGPLRATLGAGMLIGAALLTWVADACRPHYAIAAGALGAGTFMMLFSLTHNPWLGGALGLGIGLCGVWIIIAANTLLQRIVPDRARGRIFGIVDLANMAGMVGATFCLGIVRIPQLDRSVDGLLRGLAAVLLAIGLLLWRHHARRSPYPFIVTLLRGFNDVLCRLWYRQRRVGICTVPTTGPCLITANHTCGADPCFLAASSPNRVYGYLIAQEYYDLPVFGRFIRYLECIKVRRDGQDLSAARQALRQLQAGRALGVFIQGRIPGPGESVVPQEGAAVLAMHSAAPVIPVHISGIKYRDSISQVFFQRHRVRVRYGPPVDLSAFRDPRDRAQVAAATQRIWAAIQALGPEDGRVYI